MMELSKIKGIGKKREATLNDSGIFCVEDLADYFPYKYYDFTKTRPFAEDGIAKLIRAIAVESPKLIRAKGNLTFVSVKMQDEVGHQFTAMWFNQIYIKTQIYLGKEVYLYGKNSKTKKNTFIVSLYKPIEKLNKLGLLPVYHTIKSIAQASLSEMIYSAVESVEFNSVLPQISLQKYNLIDLKQAYLEIHRPNGFVMAERASQRIEIEKLVPILAINEKVKQERKAIKNHTYSNVKELVLKFLNLPPFKLSKSQENAVKDIISDMTSNRSMNRILQGDVGSGKTIVALFGAYLAVKNGHQAVIIAPTEILANQHFETAIKLFFNENISICKLTGSVRGLELQLALNRIKTGEAKLIIGTHSLITESVAFDDLTYVVIDEQHRFGVEQRTSLIKKGENPDVLVMSATPIPRTLALVVYGSLEVSTLEPRSEKSNIITNIVTPAKQADMWQYLKNKIDGGSKLYVVCSKIDEENDDDSVINFSAKNVYEYVQGIFDKLDIGLIHGKMTKDSQNKIIEKFRKGIIKVLVSTTIVEVGVDIPDSDLMVICSPERFGLATLHQLRGRIGRNGGEAHCFCLANNLNEKSYERIKFFKDHSNGFEIADFDLDSRGSGSIFGTEQHGFSSDILTNFSNRAYETANKLLLDLKRNESDYDFVLEKGRQILEKIDYSKIVLN